MRLIALFVFVLVATAPAMAKQSDDSKSTRRASLVTLVLLDFSNDLPTTAGWAIRNSLVHDLAKESKSVTTSHPAFIRLAFGDGEEVPRERISARFAIKPTMPQLSQWVKNTLSSWNGGNYAPVPSILVRNALKTIRPSRLILVVPNAPATAHYISKYVLPELKSGSVPFRVLVVDDQGQCSYFTNPKVVGAIPSSIPIECITADMVGAMVLVHAEKPRW